MNMDFKVASYNCRGLPKDKNKLLLRPDIIELFETHHIIALQETHLSIQDLKILNSLHDSFVGVGVSKTDETEKIISGRYSGGVAIFWRTELSKYIKQIKLDSNWCVGIEVSIDSTIFTILNVYMPYQKAEHEDLYFEHLGYLRSFIDDMTSTNLTIIGDFNANLGLTGTRLFSNYLTDFCNENDLLISDKILLQEDTYTYVSTREGVPHYSWLDHVVSSRDFHSCINNMDVLYSITDEDHIPLTINLNVSTLPKMTYDNNDYCSNISWDRVNETDLKKYLNLTDTHLANVEIPIEAILCSNVNCNSVVHQSMIETFYNNIIKSLNVSSEHISNNKTKSFNKPGWTEYVSELYNYSREMRQAWIVKGKKRQGDTFKEFICSKARFKYALRSIQKNEAQLRKESLAKKMTNLSSKEFWKEINLVNNAKTPLPCKIENANGPQEISELWKTHYFNIFNCLPKGNFNCYSESFESYDDIKVKCSEIIDSIKNLKDNKSCGLDGMYSEHIKYASDKLIPLLSMCFTGFFVHGILPKSIMSVSLIPVIKNKCGNISAIDNYRPIALASTFSKILESIILNRIEIYLVTNHNQFGFKKKHGTDQCIYILKEALNLYKSLNSCVSLCFLDASKAFDRVNHSVLFKKLSSRGVPLYIIRILSFWYENQTMCVRWGKLLSDSFKLSNGVRQGGILSPRLFTVYMDDLSTRLNKLKIGCTIGEMIINHLMFADDIVLISPSTYGLKVLLDECRKYGMQCNIIFNPKKSAVMFIKPSHMKHINMPTFSINNECINVVNKYTYLGHILCDSLKDDLDILRQRKKIFAQGNSLLRKFYMCNIEVKTTLFRSYVSSFYTAHLWTNYSKTVINKLYIAYHNTLKLLIGVYKSEHTRPICVGLNVKYCPALMRNIIYKFMQRLLAAENIMVKALCETSLFYTSPMWKHWRSLLYTNGVG